MLVRENVWVVRICFRYLQTLYSSAGNQRPPYAISAAELEGAANQVLRVDEWTLRTAVGRMEDVVFRVGAAEGQPLEE